MVILTDRAKIALKSALSRTVDEAGVGLRIDVSEEGGLALYPDKAKAGDEVVEHEGDVLLLIGDNVSQPLQGATIDLTDTAEGARLVVTRAQSQDGSSDRA
jgi:Fe-S cluster assembly iron-binding protein IscA